MPLAQGNLRPEHQKKITKNLVRLKKDMDAKDLTDYFIQEEIFDFSDVDQINGYNPNTTENRNNCFFNLLFKCDAPAYDVFLMALREIGLSHLADIVNNTKVTIAPVQETQENHSWIDAIPDHVKRRRLTERDLSKLSQTLGKEWEFVILDLNVSRAEIDHSIMEHQYSPTMQIYSALNRWRGRDGNAATLENFVKAASSCQSTTVDWALMKTVAERMTDDLR